MMFRFIIFFFVSLDIYAQSSWYRYDWNAVNKNSFPDIYNSTLNFDLNYYKDNIYIGSLHGIFARSQAFNAECDAKFGNFYLMENEVNMYLRKVLESTVQDTSITNKIKIFVYRSAEKNATMDGSGNLRLFIGDLADYTTESELAATFGHEVAHFVNHDAIKDYGIWIENHFRPTWGLPRLEGDIVSGIITGAEYYWFSRAEESAADFLAIKYIKKSAYSLNGMTTMFKKMKRVEIRSQLAHGQFEAIARTHPDPGDRLKQVAALSHDSLNKGKKDFVVDSAMFFKIKKMAAYEALNIDMQQDNWFSVVQKTFTNYLFDPSDELNLAILLEYTRRGLLFGEKTRLGEKSFILSRYQTPHVKESATYAFLNTKTPSLLKYLTKGFIDVTRKDLSRIKATELLDTTKLAFTTYNEAYAYFKKKAAELNCKSCGHCSLFDKVTDEAALRSFDLENNFFNSTPCIKSKTIPATFDKELCIVLPVSFTKELLIFNDISLESQSRYYDTIVEVIKSKTDGNVKKFEELSFIDQNDLDVLLGLTWSFNKVTDPENFVREDRTDWTKYAPELYNFFERNKIKSVYIVDASLYKGKAKKTFESYLFYKISLPTKFGPTVNIKLKSTKDYLDQGYKPFYDNLGTEFSYFYKQGKK